MKPIGKTRLVFFLAGVAGVAALLATAFIHLPGPDALRNRYRDATAVPSVTLRHTSDAVSAINFDFRGIDTLGEEFILFVSVMGALVLLRESEQKEGEKEDSINLDRVRSPSDALRVWVLFITPMMVVFGLYVITHGQVSPGGGFQGGVVLATAPLVVYLASGFKAFRRVAPFTMLETAEAVGAGAFVALGLAGMAAGSAFLNNFLPLGQTNTIASGGTIALISLATGIEVCAGFVLLLDGFLQELLTHHKERG